jgi:transcriptional regulator with XRE-family HTH domain
VAQSSAARLRVGAELRRLRKEAGLSGEQVASTLGWSQPKVSRIEAGRVAPAVSDIAALLDLMGAGEDLRAELLATVAHEAGDSAWIVRAGGSVHRQSSLATTETVAARLRQYQPLVLPGLVQTYDYALAMAELAGAQSATSVASTRLRRQEQVRAALIPVEFVVDARCLLVHFPHDELILIRQLSRLLETIKVSSFRLGLIPLGAAMEAISPVPFTIYDFQREMAAPLVYVETPTADLFVSAASDVALYLSLWRRLHSSALHGQEAVEYLRSIREAVLEGRWPPHLKLEQS